MDVWLAIVCGVLLLGLMFYLSCMLPTQWLKVERVHVPLRLNRKIVQISDIHIERNRIKPSVLRRIISREKPDMICLTGDYVDSKDALLRLVPFLKMIQDLRIQTYAVLGNHDYRLRNSHDLTELLEAYGIRVLTNEAIDLQGFFLIGIDDFCTGHSDENAAFRYSGLERPKVVMTHDPTITMFMNHSFDYLISGHLHGKQFALPFVFYLQPMGPLAASGIYQGLHRCNRGMYYISKGIGQSGINLRFLVRSEITVHEL